MSQRTSKVTRTAEAAADRLEKFYAEATAGLSAALDSYLSTGEAPSAATRATFRYPLLRVTHRDLNRPPPTHRRAFGRLQRTGVYETTVTHPRAFRRYLLEQLEPLISEYGAKIEVSVSDQDPHVPSVTEVYPTANWHERETWDFFGIVFDGHPALTRIHMPDDWPGHPQRKDYPLGGLPVEYFGALIPPPDERRSYA